MKTALDEKETEGCLGMILGIIICTICLWLLFTSITEVIKEKGLKNITSDIWNGENSTIVDSVIVDSVIVLGTKRYKLIEE